MAVMLKRSTLILLLITAASLLWNVLQPSLVMLSVAITLGTISYHFVMRFAVAGVINHTMRNRADYTKARYRVSDRELAFYEKLDIRRWKGKLPTYNPDLFDRRNHSWDEIAQAMCQAEVIHETIAVFSLLPILAGFLFGAWPVFIITSVLSACVDLMFVVLQRYNRPRVIRIIRMIEQRKQKQAAENGENRKEII